MKIFKVLALFYFFSIMVLGSILFREDNCISSRLVESINIQRGSEGVTFRSCWSSNSTLKTPVFSDLKTLKLINSLTVEFESFLYRNKWFFNPDYKWQVVESSPIPRLTKEQKDEDTIYLQLKDAKNVKIIRKKTVLHWIKIFRKKYDKSDKISNEILADVLVYTTWGYGLDELEDKDFSELVFSQKSLCKSKWAPLSDEAECSPLVTKLESSNKLSDWSLRPLFLKAFLDKYKTLSLKEKFKFQKDLYSKIIHFEAPKNFKLKLENLEKILAQVDRSFWGDKSTKFNPIFEDLWLYADKDIHTKSLLFNGRYFINPWNGSYFAFENFFIQSIHISNINKDGLKLENILQFNAIYVYVRNSQKIHIPSLKLAYSLDPHVFKNTDPTKAIEKVIGWNPVLTTPIDHGI